MWVHGHERVAFRTHVGVVGIWLGVGGHERGCEYGWVRGVDKWSRGEIGGWMLSVKVN